MSNKIRVGSGVQVRGGRPSSIKVSENGVQKGVQPEINFTGNVTVTNDLLNNRVTVNITASGGGSGLNSFTVGNLSPLFTASLGADPLVNPSLTFAIAQHAGNVFIASPADGSLGDLTARTFVVADLPTVPVTKGGTGLTGTGATGTFLRTTFPGALGFSTMTLPSTIGINSILYAASANAMTALSIGAEGTFLAVSSGVLGYRALVAADIPTNLTTYIKTEGDSSSLTGFDAQVNGAGVGSLSALAADSSVGLQGIIGLTGDAHVAVHNHAGTSLTLELTATKVDGSAQINLYFDPDNFLGLGAGLVLENSLVGGGGLRYLNAGYVTNDRSLTDRGYVLGAKTYTGIQTFSLTSLYANNTGIDVVATGGSDILNIGTSNADVINIGYSGSTINITGTLAYQNVTNLQVTDKLFTVNKGGGVGSGVSAGFEIEENGVITGYFATNGTRDGWDFKAPAITGVANLSLASLTGNRTYTLPDAAGTFAVSASGNIALSAAGDITFTGILGAANGGTGVANNAASTLTISGNFATTLTVTATTGVTLPTTGTLSTLAGTEILTNKTLSTGTVFSVIPTINDGITFTFNPSATVAGINVGTVSSHPSSPIPGDLWYNSTSGTIIANTGTGTTGLVNSSTGLTINHVPFASGSFRVTSSANFTFVTNRLLGTTLYMTVSAGTATAGTAPFKMTSGTNLTTAEAGAFEYNGADLFFTKSGTTRGTVLVSTAVTTEVIVSDTSLTISHNGVTYKLLARA